MKPSTFVKNRYNRNGLVAAVAASILRFRLEDLPALQCTGVWTGGYSALAGILSGLETKTVNGRVLASFNRTIYNSSMTENFSIPNVADNLDQYGNVKDMFKAELYDKSMSLVSTADQTTLVISEDKPMQCGFPKSEEYLTLAPQWADWYPAWMDGQIFDITDLPVGNCTIRLTIDPNNKFGEFQVYNLNLTWDGTSLTMR